MCGIAGFTRLNRAAGRDLAQRITADLLHRGPDQQGVREVGLAILCAVRLKIIDLAGGEQPMVSDDGDTTIAFNGEIYNHREIRRELEARGHRFHSQCDTETLLHAFLEWDTGCFARLRGMFGVAFWSESRRRLVLGRDRMGMKPLYYFRQGPDLYFGSELKAILAHSDVPRVLDLEALETFLSVNYVPGPRTLIEGIRKLPPGHWLEWRDGAVRMEAWQKSAPAGARRPHRSLDSAKEELDSLLRESVREHLVSDVPLGVWASGGLDSSTILHYAAEAVSGRLKTFSVSFAGRNFDESAWFREIARVYGTDHYEFDLNPEVDLREAIEDFAYYSDEPSADAGALPVWYLSRMTRSHVTVALSGEGADELFGGYVTYMADRLVRPYRLVPMPVRRLMRAALDRYMPVSDDKISLEYKLKRWIEGSALDPDEAHFYWNGTFSPEQIVRLLNGSNRERQGEVSLRNLVTVLENCPRPVIDRYLTIDQNYYLPDDILYKTDRMSMAHSIEVRPPFLDSRIVDFAASLPARFKIRGFRQKYILRELMRGKLPESVLHRKKTGFDIPAHDWFRGSLRPLLVETLSREAVEATGIFDWPVLESFVRDHLERRINVGYHLWGLVTLFLWMKRWKVEVPVRPGVPAGMAAPLFAAN
jgi:asparagine synthase (glutamine-hydrolysing)